jgi:hypothetical protein
LHPLVVATRLAVSAERLAWLDVDVTDAHDGVGWADLVVGQRRLDRELMDRARVPSA